MAHVADPRNLFSSKDMAGAILYTKRLTGDEHAWPLISDTNGSLFITGTVTTTVAGGTAATITNSPDNPANVTVSSGTNSIGKNIDAVVGSADVGVSILMKQKHDLVALITADGDYDIPALDSLGQVHVNPEGHHTFDGMNATTGWGVGNDDTGNLVTTTKHVLGTKSLSFDKLSTGFDSP